MGEGAVKPRAAVSKPANGPRPAALKTKVSSTFRRARGPSPGILLKSRAFHAPFRKSAIGLAFGSATSTTAANDVGSGRSAPRGIPGTPAAEAAKKFVACASCSPPDRPPPP